MDKEKMNGRELTKKELEMVSGGIGVPTEASLEDRKGGMNQSCPEINVSNCSKSFSFCNDCRRYYN